MHMYLMAWRIACHDKTKAKRNTEGSAQTESQPWFAVPYQKCWPFRLDDPPLAPFIALDIGTNRATDAFDR